MSNVLALEQQRQRQIIGRRRDRSTLVSPIQSNDWFSSYQAVVSDVSFSIRIRKVISILYNEAQFEWEFGNDMVYDDYVALSNAYKKSLDLKKHGDHTYLPEHL